ncbi:OmpA/MotB family protein [Microvirga massiliensis]|jgi:chemotaxis protein MotB|uniref:OmpA/MotB family protein n=1 Tax=Microvirga massiliensis TaxID=1033741 RepID=UPI00062BEE78|nr:flagellar motor protein MotB [Microvirga massiliensis]
MALRKKGHVAHGHGWFVTFADLMALLMSFFVMVAAYSTQDQRKLQLVAGSMRDAFGVRQDSRLAGIIEQEGIPTKTLLKNARTESPDVASDSTSPNELTRIEGISLAGHDRAFALAAASLRQALQDLPEIAELSKHIVIDVSKEGLNVSLVDQDGRSMFPEGSTQPYERTRRVLEAIAPTLRRMPNRVAVTGHTASPRPGAFAKDSPWEMSAGRAISVREILAASGMPDDRFATVAGKADAEPFFPDNPYIAANRRVTITLLREAPPIPFGAQP